MSPEEADAILAEMNRKLVELANCGHSFHRRVLATVVATMAQELVDLLLDRADPSEPAPRRRESPEGDADGSAGKEVDR